MSDLAGTPQAPPRPDGAIGINAFTLEDRLRLFYLAAAEKSPRLLGVLSAVDLGRADHQMLLHEGQVRDRLGRLAAGHPQDIGALLEALADWQVLDRTPAAMSRGAGPGRAPRARAGGTGTRDEFHFSERTH